MGLPGDWVVEAAAGEDVEEALLFAGECREGLQPAAFQAVLHCGVLFKSKNCCGLVDRVRTTNVLRQGLEGELGG